MKTAVNCRQSAPVCGAAKMNRLATQTQPKRLLKPSTLISIIPTKAVKTTFSARASRLRVMATYGSEWSTPRDCYLTVGLAHCFEKNEDGKVTDRFIIEPVSANSLEGMAAGAKTCYTHVFSLTLGDALSRDKSLLPAEFAEGRYCDEFDTRCDACARTWMRPHAMDMLLDIVPLGQIKSNFKYSIDDKRVLNFENVVNDDDNIKQDMSIDVYGRKGDKDDEAPAAGAEKEEEDDLDALLA